MARLCAVANGNNTSASTWAVINTTSYSETSSSGVTIPTTYATTYVQFTPGAITVDGIGYRFSQKTGSSGTLSVELYNHTAAASVAGSEVTINMSDVDTCTTSDDNAGWYFFKFASPITLIAANAYTARVKSSVASQLTFAGASATTPSKFLRTTTTAAPVAGDDRFVIGEWDSAGSMTTRTVTLDNTTVVDYGSASTSVVTPALSVCKGGTVESATTASTNFTQKISGNLVVYSGGTLNVGSSGTPFPSTSTFTLNFDSGTNVDFGLDSRYGSTVNFYGEHKTRWTFLTSDEAAASTVIQVTDTSGWKTTDLLVFAPTRTTVTHAETKTVSTVDSSTQVTLTAGLTNAHDGTGNVIGEVGNLTSNVKIIGTSTTIGCFINVRNGTTATFDNVEFQYLGSAIASKRGLDISLTSTNSYVTLSNCSVRNLITTSGMVGASQTSAVGQCTIENNVIYGTVANTFGILTFNNKNDSVDQTWVVSNNLLVGPGSGTGLSMLARTYPSFTLTDTHAAGFATGVNVNTNSSEQLYESKITNTYVHSNTSGISMRGNAIIFIDTAKAMRNGVGILSPSGDGTVLNVDAFGNSTAGIGSTSSGAMSGTVEFINCNFRGDTGFNQSNGLSVGNAYGIPNLIFNSCNFGQTIAHTTADMTSTSVFGSKVTFINCNLASTTEVTATIYNRINRRGGVFFQRLDGTLGDHKSIITQGVITPDSSIFNVAMPSLRITPKSATINTTTELFSFKVPINFGESCTMALDVRESVIGDGAAYNGDPVELWLKANHALGFTTDTLMAATTAASGTWETIGTSTITMPDDGVLEFYIVCNGTTGWVNIDDFSYTNS